MVKFAQIEELFIADAALRKLKAELKSNAQYQELEAKLKEAQKKVKSAKNILISNKDAVSPIVQRYVTILFDHRKVEGYEYDTVEVRPNEENIVKSAEADEKRYKRLVKLYKGEPAS